VRNIASILIAAFILTGCNDQDAKDLGQDTGKLVETAARSARNAGPVVAVNTVLGLRKDLDITGLRVTAEGSTVTIGGHVKSKKEKATVLELAKNTKGVEKLIDEIRIEP
jgi:predicted small secreted protein